jgi:hypothetical protein
MDTYAAYHERDDLLRELGYPSYQDYLASDLWQSIRSKVLNKAKGKCSICRRRAFQVHHTEYSRECLEGNQPKSLYAICGRCHEDIEFDRDGFKRKLEEANESGGLVTCDERKRNKKAMRKASKQRDKWLRENAPTSRIKTPKTKKQTRKRKPKQVKPAPKAGIAHELSQKEKELMC